jgi:hypothetical protein
VRVGSSSSKAPNKKNDFSEAFDWLVNNYFNGTNSTYNESDCERRLHMPLEVFILMAERIIWLARF